MTNIQSKHTKFNTTGRSAYLQGAELHVYDGVSGRDAMHRISTTEMNLSYPNMKFYSNKFSNLKINRKFAGKN
ncbi:MAG: hypothetical protein LBL33_06100 [Tannerella sp.]|jgi:hypothetical protein|nr:hypothetical protein [Tannerella sp.]